MWKGIYRIMRKAQQDSLLEIMSSMQEMVDQIKKELEQKNIILAQNLLEECQQAAIQVGTSIDKMVGEGTTTVSYLENYCDLVFQMSEEIVNNCNPNKVSKVLTKQIIKIVNSIKYDLKIRKEVAFFPYKASMWDSLESVYLAAKEDPDCDAYCVPIPYYDLKPDHNMERCIMKGMNIRKI